VDAYARRRRAVTGGIRLSATRDGISRNPCGGTERRSAEHNPGAEHSFAEHSRGGAERDRTGDRRPAGRT
jgi:hypothetical protein